MTERIINGETNILNINQDKSNQQLATTKNIDELLCRGKHLINIKNYQEAIYYFKRVLELSPNNRDAYFCLFYHYISIKDYEKAINALIPMLNTNNPHYIKENNLYLYLLSMIIDLPQEYLNYIKSLTLGDIKISGNDPRYKDRILQNKARRAIFNCKLPHAIQYLNTLMNLHRGITPYEKIIKNMVIQAKDAEFANKKLLFKLVKEKRYEEIIANLNKKQQTRKLNKLESNILKIVNDILSIKINGIIPRKQVFNTDNVFEAIDGCNYELALLIEKQKQIKLNMSDSSPIIAELLTQINELITSIEINQEPPIELISVKLLEYLENQDYENAFLAIEEFLKSINQEDHKYLIFSLIKLSVATKDEIYQEVIDVLKKLANKNFKPDIMTKYIESAYLCLLENDITTALIYLEIITNIYNIYSQYTIKNKLKELLNTAKLLLLLSESNEETENIDKIIRKLKKEQNYLTYN